METADLSPTEWLRNFIIISKRELELSKQPSNDEVRLNDDGYDYLEFEDDDDDGVIKHYECKRESQYNLCMIRMAPLFAGYSRLEKICKNWKNNFLPSCFTRYTFNSNENDTVNELHEEANDLEYLMNLCGSNLTYLDVSEYHFSQIMPIINANCPNLEKLDVGFKEIMSQDFENCFSNMSHLIKLSIEWQCKNSTLPMSLAKSLEQIGGTLESLTLKSFLKGNDIFSPDSLASVFPRLIALTYLIIDNFGPSQLLLQSIGEIKNLAELRLISFWPKNHPMFDTRINMYPIGNLKNLEKLFIFFDNGVRDEFLINLCNNAKKLIMLEVVSTNLTDIAINTINNLQELEILNLDLVLWEERSVKTEFITDESIQCLSNQKLRTLIISNCVNITDKVAIKLVENLPKLEMLCIRNTKITRKATRKIYELSQHRQKPLHVIGNY